MYIRNYTGKLIKFNCEQYRSDKELYRALWKCCYNLEHKTKINKTTNEEHMNNENGKTTFYCNADEPNDSSDDEDANNVDDDICHFSNVNHFIRYIRQ